MLKALVVDDHEINLYLLRSLLSANGYEVATAGDGRTALDQALRDVPDIIISDILMPVMDGFTLCRLCREDERLRDVPFVFYTATYTDRQDEELALSLGATLFLVKPTEPSEFLARIGEALERCRAGRIHATQPPPTDEVTFLKQYNQALVRKLENKVAEVEAANRALLLKEFAIESATSGIVLTDLEGRISYANPVMAELFDRSKQDLIGVEVRGLFAAGTAADDLARELAGRGEWRGELSTMAAAGRDVRTVHCAVHTVRDPRGQPVCRMMSFDDVTERQRMAEEVQRTQRLASLSLFAAGTAHDFNNLLTGLFGNIELARAELPSDSPALAHLDTVRAAFERARDLTRRLLAFAKGTPPSRRQHAALDLLQQVCALSLAGSSLRCQVEAAPGAWSVLGDANQLSQVFTNILVNARQAMDQGGLVRITIENREVGPGTEGELAPGRYVSISFADEGPGIPPDVLPRVFDPLFTTKADGAGLGLAVCYSIVQAHDGRITISSESGKGATVCVLLPAAGGAAPVAGQPCEPARVPAGGHARILVMDDERIIRNLAVRMLQQGGYDVQTASHGQDAIEQCSRAAEAGRPFDVAILDLTVPGAMGGRDAFERLRALFPNLAVVLSSGYGEEAEILGDRRPAGFLPKPYQMHELLSCVRAVTEK